MRVNGSVECVDRDRVIMSSVIFSFSFSHRFGDENFVLDAISRHSMCIWYICKILKVYAQQPNNETHDKKLKKKIIIISTQRWLQQMLVYFFSLFFQLIFFLLMHSPNNECKCDRAFDDYSRVVVRRNWVLVSLGGGGDSTHFRIIYLFGFFFCSNSPNGLVDFRLNRF